MKYKDHPFASIFPLMDGEGLTSLSEDIKLNGLHYPITLFEGAILDGRNRYQACLKVGIEPSFTEFQGADPVSFVVSSNVVRRDLTPSQRAAAAVNAESLIEKLRKEAQSRMSEGGGDKKSGKEKIPYPVQNKGQSRDELAKRFRVNPRYVQDALAIKALGEEMDELAEHDEPEWRELVEDFSELHDLFNEVLLGDKTISEANRVRERFAYEKRVAVATIEKRALPQVILADPPWRYDSQTTTPDRTIENQYKTLKLDDIKAQAPTPAPDAVLFLWATAPLLPEALDVLASWGFIYKTCAVWDKEQIGLGYWFRIQHELLLVGVRGDMSPPAEFLRTGSVIRSKRKAHSEKPEEVYKWIEKAFPEMRKLEMYARKKRDGWSSTGNEL